MNDDKLSLLALTLMPQQLKVQYNGQSLSLCEMT